MSQDNNLKGVFTLNIRLFYSYRGNYKWLRDEIIKKRYDAFRYLIPITNMNENNFLVEIYKLENDEDNMYLSLIYLEKILNIIPKKRILHDKMKISLDQRYIIYNYLKETIYEK